LNNFPESAKAYFSFEATFFFHEAVTIRIQKADLLENLENSFVFRIVNLFLDLRVYMYEL